MLFEPGGLIVAFTRPRGLISILSEVICCSTPDSAGRCAATRLVRCRPFRKGTRLPFAVSDRGRRPCSAAKNSLGLTSHVTDFGASIVL